jgi:hypothetical protein
VDDVDAMVDGRTALWCAVAANRFDNARALADAGADPWREMMSGWSPGRLSLASSVPGLFGSDRALAPEEAAAVDESRRLIGIFGTPYRDGLGIACVAGIDVAEAVRRLDAEILGGDEDQLLAAIGDDELGPEAMATMWATDVPGGMVLAQPWGYAAQMPGVTKALSAGTSCYGMYVNPKSGDQGSIARDGEIVGWDLIPGGQPEQGDEDILLSYLYQYQALAYCFAYPGLRPADQRAIAGPADAWIRIPNRDYWS